ncbi:MAG: hypothetical protein GC152_08825 [Alphaproteobacteria bacterium]|nr:hypothetical protein [Alphaproteobacteria bacterium]
MTLNRGIISSPDERDMFIGWARAPAVDRRFLVAALPLGLAGVGGAGYALAAALDDPGAGAWLTGATHEVEGVFSRTPYPMLRIADPAAPFGMRTILVIAEGKCTSALALDAFAGEAVRASGVLIERGPRRALEVPLAHQDWIAQLDAPPSPALAAPAEEDLGPVSLAGMIMDSKCFFGVMKPARGRTHKACASLCIRGGIPPSFWARTPDGREAVLLMTNADGGPMGDAILPLVAEPARVTGRLVRVGDIVQLRADAGDYAPADA